MFSGIILLLFTLGNSYDAFLLLRAGQLGVTQAPLSGTTLPWGSAPSPPASCSA